MTLVHVQREFAGVTIRQREDGYFSATDLCKAAGKLWADYFRLDSTQEFLQALSLDMEIPISVKNPSQRNPITELIQVFQGGEPSSQGTWVHRKVAIHLAQWCSAKFAVQVVNWVEDWLTSGQVPQVKRIEAGDSMAETYLTDILNLLISADCAIDRGAEQISLYGELNRAAIGSDYISNVTYNGGTAFVSYGRRLIGGAKLQIRNFAAALKVPLPEKDPRSTSIPYNPAEEAANDA